MHRAGWERLVNWQTFLWGDVEALSQNMLLAMLRTKIWTLWTIWELICLYDGGPQLADPEVRIKTSEVEIPQAWFKENVTKVRGEPGCLCCYTSEAILAKWLVPGPADHKGAFQTFCPQTVKSWCVYRGQMASLQSVWQEGVSESEQTIFWYHCFYPTSRLCVVWTLLNHSVSQCKAHPSKLCQKFIQTPNNPKPCRHSSL